MDVRLTGTGGPGGWPEPGCRCASCGTARPPQRGGTQRGGFRRRPASVLLDRTLQLVPGTGVPVPAPAGYLVARLPGGLEVTAPDGGRLLLADGPGAVPEPAEGARSYHTVLLDLLADPAQLGLLRHRGLVTGATVAAPVHIDHRVRSEQELTRRCAFWRAVVLPDGGEFTVDPAATATAEPPSGGPWRVLLLGGARSGKSAEAELRLAAEPDVTYVATGPEAGSDPDWASRVAAHRSRRPRWWRTAETLDLAGQLRAADGALLVDGIGTWLAATMDRCGIWAQARPPGTGRGGDGTPRPEDNAPHPEDGAPHAASRRLAERVADLVDAWRQTRARVVAVSDEAGSGVVPETASGRRFRDELGRLNQLLAGESEEAALVVAGRVLPLPA